MPDQACIFPQQFTQLLLTQLPVYTDMILRDVRPTDFLAANIDQGLWEPFAGVSQTIDRIRNVWPNTTKKWQEVTETSCSGAPCDPAMNELCMGWERLTYGQERQSWRSPMFCFDQAISATRAKEMIEYYVSDVLFPATKAISSDFVRKKALELAGNKLLANATMSSFTLSWQSIGDEEIYMVPSAWPTSKLTPEMIKRQIPKMRNIGYFGKWSNAPFWGGYDQFAELITDDDTAWELDKIATNQRISDLWRFQMWDAAHKYFEYGMGGQIGNYMVRIDPFSLRFNRRADGRAQRVLPYVNESTTSGIGSTPNPDYDLAQYQISFIWHRKAWQLLTQDLTQIHPTMPFMVRGLNGQWNFAIDDLGADCNGLPIANFRKNKGFYYADFRYGAKPMYTEWLTAFFHLREPQVVYVVAPCATDPGYPTQAYTSACEGCDTTYTWDIEDDHQEDGSYVLAASSVTCADVLVANGAIDAANIGALVTALNGDGALGALGTWSADGTLLILTGSDCQPVLPWVLS